MTAPHDPALKRFEDELATPDETRYELTLFVSGASELSARAIANARRLCDIHLNGRYHLSVVDMREDPPAVLSSWVLATPTLVKNRPLPVRKVIGDLSHTHKVLQALELPVAKGAPKTLKWHGGRRTAVFDAALDAALDSEVQRRSIAQRTLQSALDDGRIIVYYQPIIDLLTRSVAGFEALARIAEHDGTILAPAAFIPVAEDSGLVVPLGERVLGMACQEARRWQPAGHPECRLTVAVNLSPRQFEPGDLPTVVRERLEQTDLDPERLHLELTENAIIHLHPDTLQQLGRIRDLGVQIGLDDFGTGYASLTHLRRLPLSFVKIDQSFVQGLGTHQEDERIVSAVVDLAAKLGLRSIAEGVETKDQLDRLRELGCDHAQGYFFARPLPPNDVPTAIQHSAW